ncbi:MAG TPA: PDZ domain-containing protein, partial [Dehalococcoidia bacterium]|nr:PDZ domain-containing protein [Dehalococcoidia bacterium]
GQLAVAIGNPFRFERSMTSGIISAVGRTFSGRRSNVRPLRNLIQSDAAINPGNSGGPLLNSAGEVVGINTMIENPTRERVFVGVGFAVPINTAKASLQQMLQGAQIQHPWLGISGRQITQKFAEDTGLPVEKGIYIIQVVPSSPADKAGLVGAVQSEADLQNATRLPSDGDIVLSVDGRAVGRVEDLAGYLDTKRVGDVITLQILRDGVEQEVKVTLEAWPER